jgi:NADH dehydrogenase
MSRDNLKSMSRDSVCGCDFPPEFGVTPTPLEAIAPGYLSPAASKGRYDGYRTHGGR